VSVGDEEAEPDNVPVVIKDTTEKRAVCQNGTSLPARKSEFRRASLPVRRSELDESITNGVRRHSLSASTKSKPEILPTPVMKSDIVDTCPSDEYGQAVAADDGVQSKTGSQSPQKRLSRRILMPAVEHDEITIMETLELKERKIVKELFALYVGPGGMSLGAGLGLSKFRRLLRDCGLLEDEAESVNSLSSLSVGSPSRRKSIRDKTLWRPLSTKQADIILSRATNAFKDGNLSMKLVAPANLALAMLDIAANCRKHAVEEPFDVAATLQLLFATVLCPLCDRLLTNRVVDWDVSAAVNIMSGGEDGILQRSQKRLVTLFFNHSQNKGSPPPYRSGHWTAATMPRLLSEGDLEGSLSNFSLHRLFDLVTDQQFQAGAGKEDMLSYQGFQVCLIAIAERLFSDEKNTPADRLRVFLLRLNALKAEDLSSSQAQ
jgi:hypothetical protein